MRKITIFKTGSQRGVNTFMSGEGAIEHPMSTHSAPIGTSWTARGWRYIASILMILTLCVGNAWGTTYYWDIKIIPVFEDGATGKIALTSSSTAPAATSEDWKTGTITLKGTNEIKKMYLHAKSGDDTYFWGFYNGAYHEQTFIITTIVPNRTGIGNYHPATKTEPESWEDIATGDSYKYDLESGFDTGNGVTSEGSVMQYVYYARFRKMPYYRYVSKLKLYEKNTADGKLFCSISDTIPTTVKYKQQFIEYSTAFTETSATSGAYRQKLATGGPYTQSWYFRALGLHGKVVDLPNCTIPAGTTITAIDNEGRYRCDITMTTNACTQVMEQPKCTLVYKSAANCPVTIQKPANGGTVTYRFRYNTLSSSRIISQAGYETIEIAPSISSQVITSYKTDESTPQTILEGDQVELTATPEPGYRFNGWFKVKNDGSKELISRDLYLPMYLVGSGVTLYAEFSNAPCTVISKNNNNEFRLDFATLESAIAYVNNNADDDRDKTILLRKDCELHSGNYTIPHHTILSVPYGAEQTDANIVIRRVMGASEPTSAYCTLTLASGVHIDVRGAIEVGGTQMTGGQFETAISRPGGPTYGLMIMNSGSSITLYDESNFYAWGFVQGEGTIDVRRGATVKEQFQINDWKTLSPTCTMAIGTSVDYQLHVLPVNQYFIQNVEVKATYRPGSRLLAQVAATVPQLVNNSTVNVALAFNDVGIIGVRYSAAEKAADPDLEDDVAIFLMNNNDDSEDTWVRKSYDVAHDVQLYEANNSAYLGSLAMKVNFTEPVSVGDFSISKLDVDSRDFALPLTNNFKIHLLDGNLYITQDTELLPGSEIEINKKATMTVMDSVWNAKTRKMEGDKPQTLYIYDKDQWGTYVSGVVNGSNLEMGYGSRIKYRHGDVPTVRPITLEGGLDDAKLTVHGTVNVRGYLKSTTGDKTCTPVLPYTTISGGFQRVNESTKSVVDCVPQTDGGGAITSTVENAGTIIFSRTAQSESSSYVANYLWQVDQITTGGDVHYIGNHAIPALLTNGNGSYVRTKNAPAGKSYCFMDFDGDGKGEWVSLVEDGCFVKNGDDYYAKPKDYVKLLHGKTAEDDHTYKSADGTRTLILVDDCQWWEVVQVAGHPDLFKCEHPDNRIYYYYDYESSKWKEKRYKVTWLNWNADTIEVYSMKYGVKPQYLGTIANMRQPDDYYTYDFVGWAPEITDQTIVTGDVTYTAQYEREDRMYLVTWTDESDAVIEIGYFKMDEIPTCINAPDMTNKEWTPAVGAVTGDITYKLTTKNSDGPFTIKFVNWNWDGTDEHALKIQSVAKTNPLTKPTPPADPEKDPLADVAFEFAGWRAADNQVYASDAIPAATANAIYTATFDEQPITYEITWKNYNNDELLVQNVTPNTVPQYSGATPEHADDSYGFIGWTPTVVAATANATYTAVFELQNKTVDGETYTIPASTQQSLTTVTIADDGKLEIPATSTLTVDNLILEATSNASGQLDASKNSSIVTVNAYFDWKPNGETGTASRTWYAIAVPWEVDAENGIILKETGRHLVIGQDFDLIYYDGAERASQGNKPSCWKYVQNQSDKIMHPGQLYMMYFDPGFKTIRFAKKTGSAVLYTGTVSVSEFGASDDKDANWNGIANPKTYYASLSLDEGSVNYAQVLNNGSLDDYFANPGAPVYQTINLGESSFSVGKPLFIQPTQATSVVVTKETTATITPASAPRRARVANLPKGIAAVYRLAIAGEDQPEADNLFVQVAEDEKADRYTIGQDLVKGGVASGRAQVWVNRYDAKLSVNTQALSENEATYPLTIQIPVNGEYTLHLTQSTSDTGYTVYLTRDGEAIWNLSDGAYTGAFEKGTTNEYGLRVSARAPQITTGIDEAVVDAKGETRKVLINNTVYIIRGEHIYSADGQLVK